MSEETASDLGEAMLSLVPATGSAIGNIKLREKLAAELGRDVDEAEYFAAQQALVDAGVLVRGRGRGGSVKRAQMAAVEMLDLTAQEIPAAAKVPKPQQTGLPIASRPVGVPARARHGAEGDKVLAYRHDETRKNNPQVGMVKPENDPAVPPTTWAWDPHIDPALQFDIGRHAVEQLIDDALASGDELTMRKTLEQLKRDARPYLSWTGKAERTSFDVDTVSLHVHERIDPATMLAVLRKRLKSGKVGEDAPQYQDDMFRAWFDRPLPLREAIEFYQHERGWANRLIAGDSLLVMNSLIRKESMAGQVQMIYIDPPYGIKYGSNFQPFTNKRDVKDRKDEDLTQEPEMIKAFRDTWELGIHSYLTYLRDRLLLARELLSESGSVFVQISDENLHLVRNLCDDVFGRENALPMLVFRKTTGAGSPSGYVEAVPQTCDFLVWYAKRRASVKIQRLFLRKEFEDDANYAAVRDSFGRSMPLPKLEPGWRANAGERLFAPNPLTSQSGGPTTQFAFPFAGLCFKPGKGGWKTNETGLNRLRDSGRLVGIGSTLRFVRYSSDFPCKPVIDIWDDTRQSGFGDPKVYVVQTAEKVIERCMQMTTDPGDLVLDPTCGSGTTAYVAEKWGRRWITCDTSRVAVTLAKQRLMTASYDYYDLKYPHEGLRSGFIYKTVPHVTLKSIANNPEIDEIHAALHPAIDAALADLNDALVGAALGRDPLNVKVTEGGRKGQTLTFDGRAQGALLQEWEVPFDFPEDWPEAAREAFDAFHAARQAMQKKMDASIDAHAPQETLFDRPQINRDKLRITGPFTVEAVPFATVLSLDEAEQPRDADTAIARSGESARQHEWRDELLKTGIRGKNGQILTFAELQALAGTTYLHVTGAMAEGGERVVVSFGPEHAALEQHQVELALQEAETLRPAPKFVIFAAFSFDPEAAKDIDETHWPGVTLLKAQMNTDLLTADLKKKQRGNQSFWLMGQPEVEVRQRKDGRYEVEVHGFDYFDTRTGELESGGKQKIAMWLLDADYDERSLYPRQVFFPMAGSSDGWMKLKRAIRAELDETLLDKLHGTVSLPFEIGPNRRIAVKIVDDRGIESLKVIALV